MYIDIAENNLLIHQNVSKMLTTFDKHVNRSASSLNLSKCYLPPKKPALEALDRRKKLSISDVNYSKFFTRKNCIVYL